MNASNVEMHVKLKIIIRMNAYIHSKVTELQIRKFNLFYRFAFTWYISFCFIRLIYTSLNLRWYPISNAMNKPTNKNNGCNKSNIFKLAPFTYYRLNICLFSKNARCFVLFCYCPYAAYCVILLHWTLRHQIGALLFQQLHTKYFISFICFIRHACSQRHSYTRIKHSTYAFKSRNMKMVLLDFITCHSECWHTLKFRFL